MIYSSIMALNSMRTKFNGQQAFETAEIRPKSPHIVNPILTTAGEWYEISFPPEVVTWQLRARGDYDMYYSYDPSHATYMTLNAGQVVSEDTMPNKGIRAIYVMCNTANAVAEVEVWTYAKA
jgi:hypothetical protein